MLHNSFQVVTLGNQGHGDEKLRQNKYWVVILVDIYQWDSAMVRYGT